MQRVQRLYVRVVHLVLQAERGRGLHVRVLLGGAEALVRRAVVTAALERAVLLDSALTALAGCVVALVALLRTAAAGSGAQRVSWGHG